VVTKYASLHSTSDSIEILKKEAPRRHAGHKVGIAHTRWATHGGKTDENAHPHTDNNNRVAVVHNGTIENCTELRAELEADGVVFASETDTEVIVQMIGRELDVEG
jgi:glucosamine--fructose-6-phosphate aminotransferase (isomerizing)